MDLNQIYNWGHLNKDNYHKNKICSDIITFDSEFGQNLLINTTYNKAFFKLAPNFSPQKRLTTCGVAAAILVLNTLYLEKGLTRPLSKASCFSVKNKTHANFIWDEDNFFELNSGILDSNIVIHGSKDIEPGLTLTKLADSICQLGLVANYTQMNEINNRSEQDFLNLVKTSTLTSKQYLISNYQIDFVSKNLPTNGHFAVISAYNDSHDYILLLDPWSSFMPWIWVKRGLLCKAMHTLDKNQYRGYILVK